MIPENVRDRYYYVIVMPVNADNQGPASLDEATELTWEVWTQDLTHSTSHKYLADAIQECEALNRAHYGLDGI